MVNYTKVHGCSSYTYHKYTERKWYSWSTNVQGINLFAFIVIFTVHVVSLVLVFVFRCPLCRLYVCLFVCLFFLTLVHGCYGKATTKSVFISFDQFIK